MPDPAEILQALYVAGFELHTFDRFPRGVGVSKGNCMLLLVAAHDGWQILGNPGWKMGDFMGVLTTIQGAPTFQWKDLLEPATPERLTELETFREEVVRTIRPGLLKENLGHQG